MENKMAITIKEIITEIGMVILMKEIVMVF